MILVIVGTASTVIVPVAFTCVQAPSVVVTVYVNGEPVTVVGKPLIVKIPALNDPLTPAGNPVTVAPVALPSIV